MAPKTSASHRTIPLPQVVVTALSEHVRQFPATHPAGLLFTDDDGEALRRRTREAVDAILTAVSPVCPESKSG